MFTITTGGSHFFDWPSPFRLRWMRRQQPVEQDQIRWIHQAFQRAYGRFAQAHPDWVARRFDEQFLRQITLKRLVRSRAGNGFAGCSPTALALATAWDAQFGVLAPDEAVRARRFAELTRVAQRFLALFDRELAQTASISAQR